MKAALAAALLGAAALAAQWPAEVHGKPTHRLLGGEAEIVAYPHGDVRICGSQGSDLMFDEGPPQCRDGLRAVGVRVAALTSRQQGEPGRWGSLYLAGTYENGTFRVSSQQKWAPPGSGPGPFFETPPCPTPARGWRLVAPTYRQKATIRAYERRYRGDVTSVVYFHDQTIPVVAAFDPARVRRELSRAWARQLCVVRARWSLHALSRARRRMLGLLRAAGNTPRYGWISGAGGLSESDDGQPTTTLEVLVETPALRKLLRAYPSGLVAVDPELAPLPTRG